MQASVLICSVALLAAAVTGHNWQALAPGLDLGTFTARHLAPVGDSRIIVLRIDPALWALEYAGLSRTDTSPGRSARQWCEEQGFAASINAGMYAADRRTHVGFLESRGRVNSGAVNGYQSVAAFDPVPGSRLPAFRIFDLDDPGVTVAGLREDYESVVQNLRLVKRPGLNRWQQQEKRWSEAALGEDEQGRILFIFARSPFTMYELNRELLAMGIGLVAAQHLDGGPPAQMYVGVGDQELEWVGSWETGAHENDANRTAWPIPSVLGIRQR